jgi:hypothetical protein
MWTHTWMFMKSEDLLTFDVNWCIKFYEITFNVNSHINVCEVRGFTIVWCELMSYILWNHIQCELTHECLWIQRIYYRSMWIDVLNVVKSHSMWSHTLMFVKSEDLLSFDVNSCVTFYEIIFNVNSHINVYEVRGFTIVWCELMCYILWNHNSHFNQCELKY